MAPASQQVVSLRLLPGNPRPLGGGGFPALPPVGPVCRRPGAGCHRPRSLQSLRSAGGRGRCSRPGRGPFQRKGGPDGRLPGPHGTHPGRDRGDLGGEALQLCPGYRSGFHQDGMQQQRVSRGRQGTGRLEAVGERAVSQGGLPLDHRRGDLPGDVGGGGRGEEAPDQSAGAGTVFAAAEAHAGGAPRRRPAAQSRSPRVIGPCWVGSGMAPPMARKAAKRAPGSSGWRSRLERWYWIERGDTACWSRPIFPMAAGKTSPSRCSTRSNDHEIVEVDEAGVVTARGIGESAVMIQSCRAGDQCPVRGDCQASAPVSRSGKEKHYVDEHVFGKLKRFNIIPSEISSDSEFLRRICLDVTGTLPPAGRVRDFCVQPATPTRGMNLSRPS